MDTQNGRVMLKHESHGEKDTSFGHYKVSKWEEIMVLV